jgi:hypothetical protein
VIKRFNVAVVGCLIGLLSLTTVAQAQDFGLTSPQTSPFQPTEAASGGVTAVGDSVMLGAAHALAADVPGIVVNAKVSRQAYAAIDILAGLQGSGELGSVVVVQIGNNGTFSSTQFDEMMRILANVPLVVVVNVKVPRSWQDANNTVIANGVNRYANAVLVDWYDASIDQPGLFWGDHIHLRPAGARLYARLIANAINGN